MGFMLWMSLADPLDSSSVLSAWKCNDNIRITCGVVSYAT